MSGVMFYEVEAIFILLFITLRSLHKSFCCFQRRNSSRLDLAHPFSALRWRNPDLESAGL
jgi:hypothetical protein